MYTNRRLLSLITGCMVGMMLPGVARAGMRDALDFRSPHARCMVAPKGRILTSVGTFSVRGQPDFEVVADTRLKPMPLGSFTEFEDPSINIFNESCELVWRQSYPSLGEVGFETVQLPGRRMLQVSAISVFEPVDQVIFKDALLVSDGETLTVEISFGSDRYNASSIGRLDPTGDFALLMIHNPAPMQVGMDATSPALTALVYSWHAFADPDDSAGPPRHLFAGPKELDAKALDVFMLHWVPSRHSPFPLYKFVFGIADPG